MTDLGAWGLATNIPTMNHNYAANLWIYILIFALSSVCESLDKGGCRAANGSVSSLPCLRPAGHGVRGGGRRGGAALQHQRRQPRELSHARHVVQGQQPQPFLQVDRELSQSSVLIHCHISVTTRGRARWLCPPPPTGATPPSRAESPSCCRAPTRSGQWGYRDQAACNIVTSQARQHFCLRADPPSTEGSGPGYLQVSRHLDYLLPHSSTYQGVDM